MSSGAPPVLPKSEVAAKRAALDAAETANAVTHGAGFVISLAALYYLAGQALRFDDPMRLIGCLVFGLSLVAVYAFSTLLHSAEAAGRKTGYELFDHCAIYLLIAGTFTPFLLVPLRGKVGTAMLLSVWLFALAGIVFKVVCGCRTYVPLSLASYFITGWLPLLVIDQMIKHVAPMGVFWLVMGGLCYTVGVPFYLSRRYRYSHAIWHLFVLAGSACHFRAVDCAVLGPE